MALKKKLVVAVVASITVAGVAAGGVAAFANPGPVTPAAPSAPGAKAKKPRLSFPGLPGKPKPPDAPPAAPPKPQPPRIPTLPPVVPQDGVWTECDLMLKEMRSIYDHMEHVIVAARLETMAGEMTPARMADLYGQADDLKDMYKPVSESYRAEGCKEQQPLLGDLVPSDFLEDEGPWRRGDPSPSQRDHTCLYAWHGMDAAVKDMDKLTQEANDWYASHNGNVSDEDKQKYEDKAPPILKRYDEDYGMWMEHSCEGDYPQRPEFKPAWR